MYFYTKKNSDEMFPILLALFYYNSYCFAILFEQIKKYLIIKYVQINKQSIYNKCGTLQLKLSTEIYCWIVRFQTYWGYTVGKCHKIPNNRLKIHFSIYGARLCYIFCWKFLRFFCNNHIIRWIQFPWRTNFEATT